MEMCFQDVAKIHNGKIQNGNAAAIFQSSNVFLTCITGLSYFVLAFIGPGTMENRSDPRIIKRSIKRSRHPVHITAHEVLDFPQDYHAKGVLSLPYGDIVEPFEAWYSTQHKMSRIDYYGGKLITLLRSFTPKGVAPDSNNYVTNIFSLESL